MYKIGKKNTIEGVYLGVKKNEKKSDEKKKGEREREGRKKSYVDQYSLK